MLLTTLGLLLLDGLDGAKALTNGDATVAMEFSRDHMAQFTGTNKVVTVPVGTMSTAGKSSDIAAKTVDAAAHTDHTEGSTKLNLKSDRNGLQATYSVPVPQALVEDQININAKEMPIAAVRTVQIPDADNQLNASAKTVDTPATDSTAAPDSTGATDSTPATDSTAATDSTPATDSTAAFNPTAAADSTAAFNPTAAADSTAVANPTAATDSTETPPPDVPKTPAPAAATTANDAGSPATSDTNPVAINTPADSNTDSNPTPDAPTASTDTTNTASNTSPITSFIHQKLGGPDEAASGGLSTFMVVFLVTVVRGY
jgi:hypothetical protein